MLVIWRAGVYGMLLCCVRIAVISLVNFNLLMSDLGSGKIFGFGLTRQALLQ